MTWMYLSCKKTRNDSWSCCSVIGQKKNKGFRFLGPIRSQNYLDRLELVRLDLVPEALLLVLDFSSPEFFLVRLDFFTAPTNCPWVSRPL